MTADQHRDQDRNFRLVALVQATQKRDTLALQLYELTVATRDARHAIATIEEAPDHVLEAAKEEPSRK